MGMMRVCVYGRDYELACDDGQEAHLGKLAQMVNERMKKMSLEVGRQPENMMLVFTALMLADEVEDLRHELRQLRGELNTLHQGGNSAVEQKRLQEMEAAMAHSMHHIAERIEKLAAELDAA